MKKIILVRHGETIENVKNLYAGTIDATLTKNGVSQIEKLAQRLRNENFDFAFASDLTRSMRTTKAVLKHHKIPMQTTPLLREKDGGIYEGLPFEEFLKARVGSGLGDRLYTPTGGENFCDVEVRATQFVNTMIRPLQDNTTILVSAHGGFNMAFLSISLGLNIEELFKIGQDNTCVNTLLYHENSRWSSLLINCTEHLAKE